MKVLIDRKGLYILFIVLVLLFTGFSIAANTKDNTHISSEEYYDKNSSSWLQIYYKVDFSELYGKKIKQLKNAYQALSGRNYYEINFQYLEIPSFPGKDVFLYGYEYGHGEDAKNQYGSLMVSNVKAIQLSHNSISRFNLSVDKGRLFYDSDYHDGDIMPILLGYEYKDILKVGDEIEGRFIGKPFKFKVAGILNQDSNILIAGKALYLDRYMVMPSINCLYSPKTQNEDLFQVRHYANKISGWFEYRNYSDLNAFNRVLSEVNQTLPGEFESSTINNSKLVESIFAGISTIKHAAFWLCIILAFIIAIICPLYYFRLQAKSIPLLCVNVITGINFDRILTNSIRLFIFVLAISNIMALTILLVLGVTFNKYILAIDLVSVITVIVLNLLFLKESKLILYMGGSEYASNTKHF